MATDGLKKRVTEDAKESAAIVADHAAPAIQPHPAGKIQHGIGMEILRVVLFTLSFLTVCVVVTITQLVGTPLYLINRDYYYAYMALTKQSFGILITTVTHWFCPTVIRVSWDESVRGQFQKAADGRLEANFPERLVLLANHQVYTDWVYLWWAAYTARMHGHLFIILKESLKYVPFLSPGILFYGFIFMARKWASDQSRIAYRLQKLKSRHKGPMSGSAALDPMWLLIFPEGTNLSANTRKKSMAWAEKQHIPDLRHQLLPRSTGTQFCLEQLGDSIEWVYDCTLAYEGVPKGKFAPEYFTLRSTYFQGRPPKSVNMHWRRFAVSSIPFNDPKAFEQWMAARWQEKDNLLETFYNTGRFPTDSAQTGAKDGGYIETEVKVQHWAEIGQIFVVPAALALVANVLTKLYGMMFSR